MRIRSRRANDDPDVGMSALIDCVFLLLIFFLVTMMLKKWDKQIPITLPDSTSSLSAVANDDTFVIGLDAEGLAYTGNEKNDRNGRILYTPIDDLAVFLQDLSSTRGIDRPLLLAVERDTPMQRVIDAFDLCQLQGFQQTEVRLKDR